MIAEAIHDLLIATPAVANLLATYAFVRPGTPTPAVFTTDVIPPDSDLPAIIISEAGGDGSGGTRGKKGGDIGGDIRIYGDRERGHSSIRALALAVWAIVARANLDPYLTGYHAITCLADMPQLMSDPDGFPGYLVTYRVQFIEE